METERDTQRRIRVAVLVLCGIAVALATWVSVAAVEDWSTDVAVAIAVLGVLAIAAMNFDIPTRDSVGMSGTAMIFIGSLVVFRAQNFAIGPAIVGICAAIDYWHIRERAWLKIAFNASAATISLIGASALFWALTDEPRPSSQVILVLAVAVSAMAYLCVNAALVSVPVSLSDREPYGKVLRQVAAFDLSSYPYAVLGLGLGWVYLELGGAVVPLLVVPIFMARRTFANYLELKSAQEQTIETLILALEAKDRYTAGHAQRVATFSEYMGDELRFSPGRMERLRYAALMHDIGKLIVPNQLLNKPGRLTESEFERVKRHEFVSVELLRRIDFLAPVAGDTTTEAATAAVSGTGLVEPAIIHVADAFDAMTSTRSYRRALSQETAFEELRKGSGTQFNEGCVDALITAIERRGEQYGAGHEEEVHEWEVAPPEAGTGSAGLGDLDADRDSERAEDRAGKA